MIVRLLLWQLDETTPSFAELRSALTSLEPLEPPGTWLWNDAQERFGALVVDDGDESAPDALAEVRRLLGRDPDVFEEFDALDR